MAGGGSVGLDLVAKDVAGRDDVVGGINHARAAADAGEGDLNHLGDAVEAGGARRLRSDNLDAGEVGVFVGVEGERLDFRHEVPCLAARGAHQRAARAVVIVADCRCTGGCRRREGYAGQGRGVVCTVPGDRLRMRASTAMVSMAPRASFSISM